jgi:hypothetical protein
MQDDLLESGVSIMAVRAPAARAKVHFHIPGRRQRIPDLDYRPAKIGSSFDAAKTRVKDSDRLAVKGLELIAEQSLVLPDALEQKFGRRVLVVVKDTHGAGAHAPLGVKAVQDRSHVAVAFALLRLQSQAPDTLDMTIYSFCWPNLQCFD